MCKYFAVTVGPGFETCSRFSKLRAHGWLNLLRRFRHKSIGRSSRQPQSDGSSLLITYFLVSQPVWVNCDRALTDAVRSICGANLRTDRILTLTVNCSQK
jgi:hypothetical protein